MMVMTAKVDKKKIAIILAAAAALIIGLICITDSMKAELPQTSYPGGNIHIFETLREGWQ